ncbi:hypothetical protein TMUPMC115_0751 [Tetragenococcus muriaticus PMC-11-5]|uniref:Uncharacterized protein n=2 Tax=Tetragenococcus muriaticus TaxID=64642 RepID=A0A091C5U8_9ENTE|nr:hypothetical protein TMU3MR103_0693 [Tetragenococcus muriaticus 3MR10-3]KFN92735.1 hypothetical protein TMUPMC115_0751 [Tetragenococcus muriaticus PMC-11-5]
MRIIRSYTELSSLFTLKEIVKKEGSPVVMFIRKLLVKDKQLKVLEKLNISK